MFNKTAVAVALASTFALGASAANAASISSLLFPGQLNQLSDNSAESQNVDLNGDGLLNWSDLNGNGSLDPGEGDTLRGTLDISTIEDLTGGGGTNTVGPGSGNNGLEAIFEVEVTSVGNIRPGPGGILVADYTFGPNAAFIASLGLPAGTMVAVYEDSSPDYDRTGSIAAAEALVLDGSPLASALGFGLSVITGVVNDPDEHWAAVGAPLDPSLMQFVPAGTAIGAFEFGMSMLFENFTVDFLQVFTFPQLGGDGLIDVNASGSVLGTAGTVTGYDAYDNVDFTVFVAVPEPGILTLLGAGLIGLGAARRRSRKA